MIDLILKERVISPINSTESLRNLILHSSLDHKFKLLVKVFQALRIAVNEELENLMTFLQKVESCLEKDGIVMIITFHSLEEDLVQQAFQRLKRMKKAKIIIKG